MATALLPHEVIPQAVQVIEQLVESTPPAYQTKGKRLLQYFKDEWITKVTPHAFSVHGQKSRTYNCQESLNRNINRTIKTQGNTWDFWGMVADQYTRDKSYSVFQLFKDVLKFDFHYQDNFSSWSYCHCSTYCCCCNYCY
ncbi:uncharacterized protein LOC120352740 isoform X2 [Nilaparvata lugens]|nr:uncharacterized protein LOC120352740 isoform X2 [Nilaparvata lugens]XP_039290699.1 uncharacterized protein LOC120352740 isoform X2 [Nilaparvata lugens]XP_039290704.1 uncharacterized protein LOC120352740 isoform X2 [Nilaparvata lugens]